MSSLYDPPKLRTTQRVGGSLDKLGDGDVLVAEQLVNRLRCPVEQVVEIQVARDETRDTSDHGQPIGATPLVRVTPRVVYRDRSVSREFLERVECREARTAAAAIAAGDATVEARGRGRTRQ